MILADVEAKETAKTETTQDKAAVNKTVVEEKFSQQQFIDNAKALGYSSIAVKGAFFNCEKQELTKTEFIQLMKNFLGKKVK